MTTKKKTTKPTEPEIVEDQSATAVEPTPIEAEVQAEEQVKDEDEKEQRKFTVAINGEVITLIDVWERENPPGALAMISKPQYAEMYMVPLLEQLVGEDQLIYLLSLGADAEELGMVVGEWSKARGAKN